MFELELIIQSRPVLHVSLYFTFIHLISCHFQSSCEEILNEGQRFRWREPTVPRLIVTILGNVVFVCFALCMWVYVCRDWLFIKERGWWILKWVTLKGRCYQHMELTLAFAVESWRAPDSASVNRSPTASWLLFVVVSIRDLFCVT